MSLGIVYEVRGRVDEARQEYLQSQAILELLIAEDPTTPEYHRMMRTIARRRGKKINLFSNLFSEVKELRQQFSKLADEYPKESEKSVP